MKMVVLSNSFFPSFFLIAVVGIYFTSASIIGIPLEKLAFYDDSKDFSCLDGSGAVPFAYVNDDYCDCTDGSDEPGTSACSNGRFYCENKEHEPQYLLSSRVNDNICDCCDGSDEWDSEITCPNTCIELGKKIKEEMKRLQEVEELGYQKRSDYVAQGIQKKEEYEQSLSGVVNDLGVVTSEVESLRLAKEEAEEPELKKKEEHQKRWEEEKAVINEEKRNNEAQKVFNLFDADSDSQLTVDEVMARVELDEDDDGKVSMEEAEIYLDGNNAITFDTFKEKSWDLVSAKIREFGEKNTNDDKGAIIEEDEDDEDDENDDDNGGKGEDSLDMPPYDEETQKLIDIAESARQSFKEADDRKKKLESEKNDLEKYLNMGLGNEHEFSPLFEQCYEYTDREYTYKLCMFQKVTQRSKNGGRETSLGTWDKWTGPDNNKHSSMRYGNGERCWNGPDRSTIVHLSCGIEDKIVSASEPNKCEYALEFTTPALCQGKVKDGKLKLRVEL